MNNKPPMEKIIIDNIDMVNFNEVPYPIDSLWFHLHKLNNNSTSSWVLSAYHSDDFPGGTIIKSPYIYHKFPDFYVTYSFPDEENVYLATRTSINPKYRGNGWIKPFILFIKTFLYNNFNILTDISTERNMAIERAYIAIHKMGKRLYKKYKNDGTMFGKMVEMPRDPCYPSIWYNHRIGGKNAISETK